MAHVTIFLYKDNFVVRRLMVDGTPHVSMATDDVTVHFTAQGPEVIAMARALAQGLLAVADDVEHHCAPAATPA